MARCYTNRCHTPRRLAGDGEGGRSRGKRHARSQQAESDYPGHIRFFGAERIVEPTERGANLMQEARRLRHGAASLTVLVESSADDMSAEIYRTRYAKGTGAAEDPRSSADGVGLIGVRRPTSASLNNVYTLDTSGVIY